jgi:hypothetical protein
VMLRGGLLETADAYRQSASLNTGGSPEDLNLAARAALRAGDAAAATADLAALEATGVRGPAVDARRASIQAGLAALGGQDADALVLYRDAIRRFRDGGLPLDEALTAIEMATLLDPVEPAVRAAVAAAREILTRLAAAPFIVQLDAAVAGSSGRAGDPAALPGHVRAGEERGLRRTEGAASPPA